MCRGLERVKLVVSFDEHARLGMIVYSGQLLLQSLPQQSQPGPMPATSSSFPSPAALRGRGIRTGSTQQVLNLFALPPAPPCVR